MTAIDDLQAALRTQWCDAFNFIEVGERQWAVRTPFVFGDGDVLPFLMELGDDGRWILGDRGGVAAHADLDGLPNWNDVRIEQAVRLMEANGAHRDLELARSIAVRSVVEDPSIYDLADFLMALIQVAGIPHLYSKPAAQRFVTSGIDAVEARVPEQLRTRNWKPDRTDGALFRTDVRVEATSDQPLLVFFVSSEDKADRTSGAIRQYRDWRVAGSPIAVTSPKAEKSAALRRMRVLLGDPADGGWEHVKADVDQWDGLLRSLERHGVPLEAAG